MFNPRLISQYINKILHLIENNLTQNKNYKSLSNFYNN